MAVAFQIPFTITFTRRISFLLKMFEDNTEDVKEANLQQTI